MEALNQDGLLNVLINGGVVVFVVAIMLVVMSITSWCIIVSKLINNYKLNKETDRSISTFIRTASVDAVLKESKKSSGILVITKFCLDASTHYKKNVDGSPERTLADYENFLTRAIRKRLVLESKRLEYGLTTLATIGSIAPFIGLLGTVWGIYHALITIHAEGQASLDKVAGPVGEALVMTAAGLAVAIPAVIAYNHLVRANARLMSKFDEYSYHLHILFTTGGLFESVKAHHYLSK